MKTKGEVFHIKSYFAFSSFAGMYPPRHSVLKGPWQFPCPILAGLKVPVYKVKFVIRKFLPGGNYHQVAVIISSDHTMPHYTWWIYLISLHFNFRGQDKTFLINSITLLLKLAGPPEACRETTVTPSLLLSPFSSSTLQSERQVVTNPAARHGTDFLRLFLRRFVGFGVHLHKTIGSRVIGAG